jgi:hypothetical protein
MALTWPLRHCRAIAELPSPLLTIEILDLMHVSSHHLRLPTILHRQGTPEIPQHWSRGSRRSPDVDHHQDRLPTFRPPQNWANVNPSSLPTTSPVHPGDELAGFWPPSLAMALRDLLVIGILVWGPSCNFQEPICKSKDFVVIRFFRVSAALQKIINNHRNTRKIKIQLCWFPCEDIYIL